MGEIEKNLLNLIIKEKKLLIAGAIVGLLFFLIYYFFFFTPLYTSTSNLYIKNIVKPSVVAPLSDSGSIRSESGYSNPLFNLYELLKSENIAHNVYKRVKEEFPKDLGDLGVVNKESFFGVYLGLVTSEVIPSTDVLTVSVKWPDRKNAKKVLEIIIDEFRKENLKLRRSLDTEKRIYLEQQTEVIAQDLEDLREKIKDYKIENRLTDAAGEALNFAQIRVGIAREINTLKAQIQYNKASLKEFANQLGIKDPITALKAAGIGNDPFLVNLSQALAGAQQELAKLKTKFTDKYPGVIQLKSQIEQLKTEVKNRQIQTVENVELPKVIYDGPSTQIVSQFALTHVEMLSQQEMLKTLQQGIEDMHKEEEDLHEKQIGLANLQKQEQAFAAAYQNIKAKQLEAQIKENEIVNNMLTLKSPTSASLFQLGLLTRLLGFLILGALAGLGVAYIKQGVEDKWSTLDELKRITGQDILGVIPWLKDEFADNAEKIYDAAYANIASEIVTKANQEDLSILSFISTSLYQNKSVVIDNVAELLNSLEKPSIIIDFSKEFDTESDLSSVVNFINTQLRDNGFKELKITIGGDALDADSTKLFNEFYDKNKAQILELIKKAVIVKEYVKEGDASQLYYLGLGKGKTSTNLKYMLSTRGYAVLLKCLKKEFDFVFINTPHGNFNLPEINFIKKNSEALVLIASMDSSKEALVNLVKNSVENNQKILGLISREKDTELEKYYKTEQDADYLLEENI